MQLLLPFLIVALAINISSYATGSPPAGRFASGQDGLAVYWQWLTSKKDVTLSDFDRFLGFLEGRLNGELPSEWTERLLHKLIISIDEDQKKRLTSELSRPENANRSSRFSTSRRDESADQDGKKQKSIFKKSYEINRDELTLITDKNIRINLKKILVYDDQVPEPDSWKAFPTSKGWVVACPGQWSEEYLLFLLDDKTSEIIWKSNVRAMSYPHTYSISVGGSYHHIQFTMVGEDLAIFGNSTHGHYIEVFDLDEGDRKFAAKFH